MNLSTICLLATMLTTNPGDQRFDLSRDLSVSGRATFDRLWKDEMESVRKSRDKQDDVALAAKMLETSRKLGDAPDVQQVTWQMVVELALADISGIDLAEEAADELMRAKPDDIDGVRGLMIDHIDGLYRNTRGPDRDTAGGVLADWLTEAAESDMKSARFDQAAERYRRLVPLSEHVAAISRNDAMARVKLAQEARNVQRKANDLEGRVAAGRANESMRAELTRIYLTELDDLDKAAKHVTFADDRTLRDIVRFTAKEQNALTADEAETLGKWYHSQADGVSPFGKTRTLHRALDAYRQFLDVYDTADARRLEVELAVEAIEAALEGSGGHSGQRVDLLRIIQVDRDAIAGEWSMKGDRLVLIGGDVVGRLQLPYKPPAEYDFIVEFTRDDREAAVAQICSSGNTSFIWSMGSYGNTIAALSNINDDATNANPTTIKASKILQNKRKYRSIVQVRKDHVTTIVDGRKFVNYETDYSDLALDPVWNVALQRLGVGAHTDVSVIFHKIEVIEVSGKGEIEHR